MSDSLSGKIAALGFLGGTGGIEATMPEISSSINGGRKDLDGTLPELSFSGDFQTGLSIRDSYLPALEFEGSFGFEMVMAATLPGIEASLSGGLVFNDLKLPALSFTGELKREMYGDLNAVLPEFLFSGESGGTFNDLKIAALSFSGTAVTENNGSLQGTLPQLKTIFTDHSFASSVKVSGYIPPLSFEGSGTIELTGGFSLDLPALRGSFSMEPQVGCSISMKLPPLEFTGKITGSPYFTIDGMLPQLNMTGTAAKETPAEDMTVTGDDIIRHRRYQ